MTRSWNKNNSMFYCCLFQQKLFNEFSMFGFCSKPISYFTEFPIWGNAMFKFFYSLEFYVLNLLCWFYRLEQKLNSIYHSATIFYCYRKQKLLKIFEFSFSPELLRIHSFISLFTWSLYPTNSIPNKLH